MVVMPPQRGSLNVYQAGKLTVVSFVSAELLDQIVVSECREEIAELIREHHCEVLAFDLTGVKLVPSGMLGMLASLGRLGVEDLLVQSVGRNPRRARSHAARYGVADPESRRLHTAGPRPSRTGVPGGSIMPTMANP